MVAARTGRVDVFKELVESGANPAAADTVSSRRLRCYFFSSEPPLAFLLHLVQSLRTVLHYAALGGRIEIARLMLPDPRVDINARSNVCDGR
jgi:ankyrin repeat protein